MEYTLKKIKRLLNIKLPKNQTAFLWGPRKTGKTFYLKENFPKAVAKQFSGLKVTEEDVKKILLKLNYTLFLTHKIFEILNPDLFYP